MVFQEEIKDVLYPSGKPQPDEAIIKAMKHIANKHVENLDDQQREIKEHIKTLKVQRFTGVIEMIVALVMITLIIVSYIKYRKNGN